MKKILLFLCLQVAAFQSLAQLPLDQNLLMQVKAFEQFLGRFNFEKMPNNQNMPDSVPVSRQAYILALFNQQNAQIQDTDFQHLALDFVSAVCRDSLKIGKISEKIIAETHVEALYKGKPQSFRLFFTKVFSENGSHWAIVHLKAPFLMPTTQKVYFPPKIDETSFMASNKFLNPQKISPTLFVDSFKPDLMSLFYQAIADGSLKITLFRQVKYHILEVKDWAFILEDFKRDSPNSGILVQYLFKYAKSTQDYLAELP